MNHSVQTLPAILSTSLKIQEVMMHKDDALIIVSGLPRSGTSMMMKMLEAGGIEVVQDGIRTADPYNPGGYYEFERVKKLKENSSWIDIANGKAIKILFNFLYDLPADKHYKIIFMERNIEEVIASQNKMLERRGESQEVSDEEIAQLFNQEVKRSKAWLAVQKNFECLYIFYSDILRDPNGAVQQLSSFLDNNLNTSGMIAVVDKSLYRNRNK
jgi:hypothetical protein